MREEKIMAGAVGSLLVLLLDPVAPGPLLMPSPKAAAVEEDEDDGGGCEVLGRLSIAEGADDSGGVEAIL